MYFKQKMRATICRLTYKKNGAGPLRSGKEGHREEQGRSPMFDQDANNSIHGSGNVRL